MKHLVRRIVAVSAVFSVIAVAAPSASGKVANAPKLQLVAASSSVTVDRWAGEPGFYLNLGTYLSATGRTFEVRVARRSYADPIVATQIVREGQAAQSRKRLPAGLVRDFAGFPDFLHVTITDSTGEKVLDTFQDFCPANQALRIRPDAETISKYPVGCPFNPFTLGAVWGIQAGWGVNTTSSEQVDLADGTYTARIGVTKRYQKLFGIEAGQKTVQVIARTHSQDVAPMTSKKPNQRALIAPPVRPKGQQYVSKGPKPDLRPLPAWGIAVSTSPSNHKASSKPYAASVMPGKDYLQFSATIWNAGPSPMVVDGFRSSQDLMDAYQYFYDAQGNQIGYAPTGTMEWDYRDGHEHWHFTDFANYRLLDADKKLVMRSQKEAFCLANTDAIDYTVKNAEWKPENTDLHTACGNLSAISVRQVLDVGNGDTYVQSLPGQSFDIHDLPNGVYFIELTANPEKRLYESNEKNNTSFRKIILQGVPGNRKVKVPPVGLVAAP